MAGETDAMSPLRIAFFGTPAYAVPALEALTGDNRFDVALVVSQPDRPAGRAREPRQSAVKAKALELGLPLYQPESLRSADARAPLDGIRADAFVVAAYGLIFGKKTLAIPRLGCVNLHASVLPAYRGASPVTAAILSGDRETGVTLMRMDAGLDTGPLISVARTPIEPLDTTDVLTERLAVAAGRITPDAIAGWALGDLPEVPQPAEGATLVRPLVKADGWLDWSTPAEHLERRVRAMHPWPLAWTTTRDDQFQVLAATVVGGTGDAPGTLRLVDRKAVVACGEGALRLDVVRRAGGKPLDTVALVHGRKLADGDVLGRNRPFEEPPPLMMPAG